jgi:hypothetical protein
LYVAGGLSTTVDIITVALGRGTEDQRTAYAALCKKLQVSPIEPVSLAFKTPVVQSSIRYLLQEDPEFRSKLST